LNQVVAATILTASVNIILKITTLPDLVRTKDKPMSANALCLHHELALLVLDDSKGTFEGSMYPYGFAGAILSELLLQGFISVTEDKEKMVSVALNKPVGDPILDDVMTQITGSSKPRNLQHWVSKVAGLKDLKHRIAEQLSELGIVAKAQGKVLWIFTRKIWPELDGSYEDSIRRRMSSVMFFADQKPDNRTAVLISLAKSIGVLNSNFAPVELRQHDARIKEIAAGKLLAAGATQETIAAVQAAMMAGVIASSVAASAASS
jgi:golgi phosphoprotein 3